MLSHTVVSRPIDGAPPMINLPLEHSEAQERYGQDWRARWGRSSCRLRILRGSVARLMPNELAAALTLPCACDSAAITTARSASAKELGSDGGEPRRSPRT